MMILATGCQSTSTNNYVTTYAPPETVPWTKVLDDIEVLKALNPDMSVTGMRVNGSIEEDQVKKCRVTLSGEGKEKAYLIDPTGVTEL